MPPQPDVLPVSKLPFGSKLDDGAAAPTWAPEPAEVLLAAPWLASAASRVLADGGVRDQADNGHRYQDRSTNRARLHPRFHAKSPLTCRLD